MDARLDATTEADLPAVMRILSLAFAAPMEGMREWLAPWMGEARVMREGGSTPGCLMRIPMGMNLLGRAVPCVGIAGVGVAPEARGRGVAKAMMTAALAEARSAGAALSALYASTATLYRSVGYEHAGHRFQYTVPLHALPRAGRQDAASALEVRAIGPADEPGVEACYRSWSACVQGSLERGPYVWTRVRRYRDVVYQGFAVAEPGGPIEGYLYLTQSRRPDTMRQTLTLSDLAFTTARAGRRLLTLLKDFDSMADEVVFFGGPTHPALTLLPEARIAVALKDYWLVRIAHLPRAIEGRAYPAGLSAELHLDVRDAALPENAGRWTVRVEGGSARCAPGGRGELRLDARALAPLYTGFLSGRQLALLGAIEGPPGAVDAADAAFASPTPWMSDFF